MNYKNLGSSAIKISVLGFGCMGMTHAYGPPSDETEMIKLIHSAIDLGITFFDTAECYIGTDTNGQTVYNEELVGKALKPYRDKVIISTKFGVHHTSNCSLIMDSSPNTIRKSIDSSLKRLGMDYVDLYYQHRIDPDIPPEEVAGVMQDLIREGKIRAWGISEAGAEYIRRADKVCKVSAIQNRYSMMYREYEYLLPILNELNITFVAHSPLANGFLSGKYDKNSVFDKRADYRNTMPQFKVESIDKNRELLAMLNNIAETKYSTPAQISLAWLMSKGIVPIPGTRKLTRLEENIGAANIALTQNEISKIDSALHVMQMSEVFGGHKAKYKKFIIALLNALMIHPQRRAYLNMLLVYPLFLVLI